MRSEPAPPSRLPERYRIRRHIATGGMASVWCAEDRVLDRKVAIKILADRFAHDRVAVLRFKREARAAARAAAHAHVVTVYDVGELEPEDGQEGARAFLVMEYLAGGTVADAIRVGAVRRHESMRWLSEAASALDHAHARGIVHRDVKPANFLLDRSRVLHVADFGIARMISEETITSSEQLFGTAAYLSPEQALGRAGTSASDRYALGVAAFELLAGERPFTAAHFAAQARQHIEDAPPSASARDRSLPPAVDAVLQRAMAKEPGARFATATEFVDTLRVALTQTPASARALPHRGAGTGYRRPVPGRPAPGRPAPGRPAPGRPATARPATARPATARPAPTRTAAARPATARSATSRPGPGRPAPAPHRHRGRLLALAALLLTVAGVAAASLAAGGESGTRARSPATGAVAGVRARTGTAAQRRIKPSPAPASRAASAAAQRLQATGHREMLDGDYQTAIPTLREAVSSAAPGSLTYAYALYDLGRSLILGGDPVGAIPVLQQRLKIPNQTTVVKRLLEEALRAAGQQTATTPTQSSPTRSTTTKPITPTTATSPPAPQGPGRASGRGPFHTQPSGGAGLAPPSPGRGHGPEHSSLVD